MGNIPKDIGEYLKTFAAELGDRVVTQYPPLYQPGDPLLPELARLRRKPFPAQTLAIMGVCRRFDQSGAAAVIAECGTGKTLVALASVFAHARGSPLPPFSWCRPNWSRKLAESAHWPYPASASSSSTACEMESPRTVIQASTKCDFATGVSFARVSKPA